MSIADYCLSQMGIPRYVPRRQALTRVKAETSEDVKVARTETVKTQAAIAPQAAVAAVSNQVQAVPPTKAAEASVKPSLAPPQPVATKPPRAATPIAEPAPATVTDKTRLAAIQACGNLKALNTLIQSCTQCALHQHRKQAVPGAGVDKPTWLLVGEAPGAEEDESGLPFVGHSGKLLSGIFAYFGISREPAHARNLGQAYITNAVKCRPTDNRTPHIDEITHCRPFLEKQIALIQPKIIMAVGRIPTMALLGDDKIQLAKMRGRVLRFNPSEGKASPDIPIVATYHPAFLIRNPKEKRSSWDDIVFAINVLRDKLKRSD